MKEVATLKSCFFSYENHHAILLGERLTERGIL